MNNIFLSNIVRPGTMFEVIKPTKDNIFGIGTVGFVGYVKGQDQDFPNVIFYKVVIIRRGKSGKARLEYGEISVPIFLPEYKNSKSIFPKINRKHFVFVNTSVDLMPKKISEFNNHSFLGWVTAWGCFLNKLHTTVKRIKIWPFDSDHTLNIIRELPNKFIENPAHVIKNYTSHAFKTTAVIEIRLFESTLSRCAMEYLCKTTYIEHNAIINLSDNIKDLKLDAKQLEETRNFIVNKLDTLKTAIRLRKQKEIEQRKILI